MSESIWKKEITFRRKPKAPKEPKQEKQQAKEPHKAREIVGLRIGSSQLSAARIANNGHAELQQLARVDLERGVVVNGEVRDADALTRALKSFFSSNKLPRERCASASRRTGSACARSTCRRSTIPCSSRTRSGSARRSCCPSR
jgi:hypothetical protein